MSVAPLIDAASKELGSDTALARAIGVSQNAIWQARRRGHCSAELAVGIHSATGGRVPKWALRPDLWESPSPQQVSA